MTFEEEFPSLKQDMYILHPTAGRCIAEDAMKDICLDKARVKKTIEQMKLGRFQNKKMEEGFFIAIKTLEKELGL